MILSRLHRKIEHLRQQPEPVRLRAATLLTAGSGLFLVILWLAVLLPLQLALTRPTTDDAPGPLLQAWRQFRSNKDTQQAAVQNQEQAVSGARVSLPSPSPSATPSSSFAPIQQQELPLTGE